MSIKTSFIAVGGNKQEVELTDELMMSAVKSGNPVAYINTHFSDADIANMGTAFEQFKVQAGLIRPDANNPFGLRSATIGDVLEGKGGFNAAGNTQQTQSPFGTASRAFAMVSVIDEVTSEIQKDRTTDKSIFNSMVAVDQSVATDTFEQPVVDYTNAGGAESAKAQRVAQGARPPNMLFFKTSDRIRRIPAWNIGMEWTDQALKNTTIDYVARTTAHFVEVEQDERVYNYLSTLFSGDGDLAVGAVSPVTTTSLDAAATGGVVTHKSWVKWLARNRKYRKITHVVADIDTYLKVEGRTGRPGTNSYDPTLARIDPQAVVLNSTFGGDVKWFLVEPATAGGPVPANTVWGLDASIAVSRVTNTAASYQAVEEYAMRRVAAMRMDWAEAVYRTLGDSELRCFDALTIS